MDRNEAVLRELNLYPLWVRRNLPALEEPRSVRPDRTTNHSTKLSKNDSQVAGYELVEGHVTPMSVDSGQALTSSARTEINNIHADSPVVTPVSQVGDIDWPQLRSIVRDCTACKLRAGCTQTVFGVGDEQADWLFVGEGPGADEDAQGEPFVGQAGKLLDNMLLAIKLKRGENVYIANVVKCRPPNNRNPDAEEIAQCLPYLQRQISLIKPKLIVALGKVASTALLGKDVPLGSLRGTLHDFNGTPLVVTYHPAYLLRSPSEKAKAWQDLCFAVKTMVG